MGRMGAQDPVAVPDPTPLHLQRLLGWMARQDFATLTAGEPSLLRQVEEIVVESHHNVYAAQGRQWSRPIAYHWLGYEDPLPVARLLEGVKRLRRRGARFDPEAVEKACAEAGIRGFLN